MVIGVVGLGGLQAPWEIATADEVIYVAGVRNLVERGTLATNFYLPHSILRQGHPHRDVHMPGYLFLLAGPVLALGAGFAAALVLNVAALAACATLGYRLARGIGCGRGRATAAAAFLVSTPPLPGYVWLAFPEVAIAAITLLGLLAGLRARDARTAALAGIAFAMGPLLRESLLLHLPFFLLLIPFRPFLLGFLPAGMLALAAVSFLFGRGRAVHANQLFPSILEDSLREGDPWGALSARVAENVARNLGRLAELDPFAHAEDAVLVFEAVLFAAVLGLLPRLEGRSRRLALAFGMVLALLVPAVLALFVTRAVGRVWGGVRALMPLVPVGVVLLVGNVHPRSRIRGPAIGAAAVLALGLTTWQLRFIDWWKQHDGEAQRRFSDAVAPAVDPYHPRRILVRGNEAFLFGLERWPVEVVWPLRSDEELLLLERTLAFDFVVVPRSEPMKHVLNASNPRYERVVGDGSGRWRVWRRRY